MSKQHEDSVLTGYMSHVSNPHDENGQHDLHIYLPKEEFTLIRRSQAVQVTFSVDLARQVRQCMGKYDADNIRAEFNKLAPALDALVATGGGKSQS